MRLLLLLSSVIFACAAPALSQETSDREQWGYKGPVKTVRTKTEGLTQSQAAPGRTFPEVNHGLTFDRDGRKVEDAFYEQDGTVSRRRVYTYDADVVTEESYGPDGRLLERVVKKDEFDKARGTSRTTFTRELGGKSFVSTVMKQRYDSRRRLVESSSFDSEGVLQSRSTWRYGANGGLEEFVFYDGAGSVNRRTVWVPEGARTFVYGDDGALVSTETQRRQVCEDSDHYGNCKRGTTANTIDRAGKIEQFNVISTRSFTYY